MKKFLIGVLSESDGTPSFSRIASAIVVVCAVGWISYIVVTKLVIPELTGLAAILGSLYGMNRLGAGIAAIGKKNE